MIQRIYVLLLTTALFSCARQSAPTGGPKDTTPPGIDTLRSTPNFATRQYPQKIELKFDEWVTLSEANAQVVVSPPLAKRPEVTLKGKTVVVKLDKSEKLRDSTTYTINFGTAVKDLHEGNAAKDLRFVFSTGDFIDSLIVKGRIVDALTGEPVDNISVMLYDNSADSVLRKERPYYFSRTDKTGSYEIRNVKSGRFKVAAIEDGDQNLRWDGDGERIAFLDTLLQVHDSMRRPLFLRIFKNQPKYRLTEKNAGAFGVVKLKFTTTTDSATVRLDAIDSMKVVQEWTQDSILVWYDFPQTQAWQLYVNNDTVPVKALSRTDFLKQHNLRFASDQSPAGKKLAANAPPAQAPPVKLIQQTPDKPAVFEFNYPVSGFDVSKWAFYADSILLDGFTLETDSAAPRKLRMKYNWQGGRNYRLDVLPGAVTDLWGLGNADTLRRLINVPGEKQLGGLILSVENLSPGKNYVLQLLNGTVVEEERVFTATAPKYKLTFNKLIISNYTAKLIEDQNQNGRWDTGDYRLKRQPEPIFTKKIEGLRANWELEASVVVNTDGIEEKKKKK
ncbi:MAG: Ig-like domain-containing protein [Saprospiraceae bacterium]|nr:Ig-like domain-containing protein [Saprospiraceae bacterium]